MADVRLTEGALLRIRTDPADDNLKPILQVVDLRQVNTQQRSAGGQERYRMVISDGSHTEQGMLATQQNQLVQQGLLQKGSVVRLNSFTCTLVQSRRYLSIGS